MKPPSDVTSDHAEIRVADLAITSFLFAHSHMSAVEKTFRFPVSRWNSSRKITSPQQQQMTTGETETSLGEQKGKKAKSKYYYTCESRVIYSIESNSFTPV